MKKVVLLMSSFAVCAALSFVDAGRKPAHASTPAVVTASAAAGKADTFNLVGSEWLLEDLSGAGVMDNVRATLSFPEGGKVAGRGSCNRFFGPAEVAGSGLKLGPLGSTRMACPEAVMNQETKYLNALQAAERYEWKDPYLLVYCKGFDKPLRFTREPGSATAAH
jgi:heat shock protein HslJ